jgi:flagellar biosynthesis/type III secretory pathway protein FliH
MMETIGDDGAQQGEREKDDKSDSMPGHVKEKKLKMIAQLNTTVHAMDNMWRNHLQHNSRMMAHLQNIQVSPLILSFKLLILI